MNDEDARDAAIEAAWRALPVERPPAGFADRVQARHDAGRRRRWIAAAAALAAAALIAAALWSGEAPSGAFEAHTRTTVTLGARAVAVVEAGGALRWAADGAGLRVEQPAGAVFYRVDDGPLTVETPAGEVAVRGTCFTVEVTPMDPRIKAGALGALAGIAVTVAVYEGSVALRDDRGEVTLAAGEHGRLDGAGPRRVDPDRAALAPPAPPAPPPPPAPPRVVAIAPPGAPVQVVDADGAPELRAEVEALRAEVAQLLRELAAERSMRVDAEGEPVAFPPALDDRFREPALRQSFLAALGEAGIDGEIKSIDCSEFPCVVYGDLHNPDDKALERLRETEAMRPYQDAANSTSAWGQRLREGEVEDSRRTFFAVALMPKDIAKDGTQREQVDKRLRLRNDQAFEAFRAEMEPPPE